MTPAEQYRKLANRLQAIAEDEPQPNTNSITGELPGWDSIPTDEPLPKLAPPDPHRAATASSSPQQQDPAQVQQGMAQLQRRCQSLLYRLSQSATPYDQQIMSRITIRVNDDPEDDDIYSIVSYTEIDVDYSQWNDAPDSVLLWSLGHEAGHICMAHRIKGNSQQQLQQQELAADAFATRLCLGMGISGAPAFKWANDKRDRLLKLQSVGTLHQNKLDQMSDPANRELNQQSSHPTYQQRFDAAGQQGFELSQVDTDQLDRFIQHMSRTA